MMTMATKNNIFREYLKEYLKTNKEKRGMILNHICFITKMHRKAAIRKFGQLQMKDPNLFERRGRVLFSLFNFSKECEMYVAYCVSSNCISVSFLKLVIVIKIERRLQPMKGFVVIRRLLRFAGCADRLGRQGEGSHRGTSVGIASS